MEFFLVIGHFMNSKSRIKPGRIRMFTKKYKAMKNNINLLKSVRKLKRLA